MSQSAAHVPLHIVFSTKNRQPYIDSTIESELHAYITAICSSIGVYVYQIGGMEDHVHIFCKLTRTLDISALLQRMKKDSSKWIKSKGKKYADFSWQRGYGAFGTNITSEKRVIAYIKNQKEHHKVYSFQDEYRKFLRAHGIPFDEKYVWD